MKLTGIFDNRATMTRERWLHGEKVWSLPARDVESGSAFKFGTRPGFGSYPDQPATSAPSAPHPSVAARSAPRPRPSGARKSPRRS